MSAERLSPDREPTSAASLNDNPMDVYEDDIQLPDDAAKAAACYEHLRSGAGGELVGEFWIGGCVFPGEGDPQIVRYQLACNGLTRFRKRCGLRITQYDTDGNELNSGRLE